MKRIGLGTFERVKNWPLFLQQEPSHFLFVAVGTDGDVFPLLTLAAQLSLRGHQITFLGPAGYADIASRSAIDFVPLSSVSEYQRSVRDMFLTSTRYGSLFLLRHAIGWNRIAFETMLTLKTVKPVIIATDRPMLWTPYMAHAHLGFLAIRADSDPPLLNRVPGEAKELPPGKPQYILSARVEREWSLIMQDFGVRVGPRHLQRITKVPRRQAIPRVGLYPSWLTAENDKSAKQEFGFLPAPERRVDALHNVLSNAITKSRLIIFLAGTFGASRAWSSRFFAVSIAVCLRLNRQGLLLGRDGLDISNDAPHLVTWQSFIPLRQILPYASILVHHGGMGTAAAALECGVPQLIIPRFGCQPSTAEWLRRLGVCIVLEPHQYTVGRATCEIATLLGEHDMRRMAARKFAGRCYLQSEAERLCRFVEQFAKMRLRGALPR